jgi:hypothetical protein
MSEKSNQGGKARGPGPQQKPVHGVNPLRIGEIDGSYKPNKAVLRPPPPPAPKKDN